MQVQDGDPLLGFFISATILEMDKRLQITILGLIGIMVLAIGFRLYDIQGFPPGLFPDEAANGEDALLIMEGDYRAFYPRGNGREGLYYYLEALSIATFGIGVWQLHAVSAVIGILTVLATYFATHAFFGRLAGLFTALFAATSYWHVALSRTGFRGILAPLFIAGFTAFVGYTISAYKRGNISQSYIHAALAGAMFAGGFYSYIAFRAMVGVVLGIVILLLLAALHPKIGFPHGKRYGKQLVVGIIASLIVFAPLGWHFIQHPDEFVGRAGQVSVFNEELQEEYGGGTLAGTILYSTRETLKSFFVGEGDSNWRHSVAGFPLVNPLVGLLFITGLIWTINGTVIVFLKIFKGEEVHLGMIYPYLILVLVGMLAPTIATAEGIPHGLRSLGLFVPIVMVAGVAGAVVTRWVQRKVSLEAGKSAAYGVVIGVVALMALYDGVLYFSVARSSAEAYYDYRGDLTEVSEYILRRSEDSEASKPYLVLDTFSLQTTHFLTHTIESDGMITPPPHDYLDHPDVDLHRYQSLDPSRSHHVSLLPGEVIIFTQSTLPDADRYVEYHDNVELIESRTNRFGEEIMRVYGATSQEESNPQVEGLDLDAS